MVESRYNCIKCGGTGEYRLYDRESGDTETVSCAHVSMWYLSPRNDGKDWAIELIRKQFGDGAILKGDLK